MGMPEGHVTGPVKTVFDLDDQVPVSEVTLPRALVVRAREETRRTSEATIGNNIVFVIFDWKL